MSTVLHLPRTADNRWLAVLAAGLLACVGVGALVAVRPDVALWAAVLLGIAAYVFCVVRWPTRVLQAYLLFWPPLTYWAIVPLGAGVPDLHVDRFILASLVIRSATMRRGTTLTRRIGLLDAALLVYLLVETLAHFHTVMPLTSSLQDLLGFAYLPVAGFWLTRRLASATGPSFVRQTANVVVLLGAYSLAIELVKPWLDLSSLLYPQGRAFTWSDVEGGRAAGPFYNPSIFGAVASLCFYIAARRALRESWVWLLPVAGFTYAVLISFQRSAWLGVVALGMLLGVEYWRMRRAVLVALLGGVLLSTLLLVDAQPDGAFAVPMVDAALSRVTVQDDNIGARLALTQIGWSIFVDAPVFGRGVGASNFARPNLTTSQFITDGVVAHNTFMVILADRGLFTFLPLLAWLALVVGGLARSKVSDAYALEARQIAWASLITLLITGSVIDVHYFPYYLVLTWVLVAQALKLEEAQASPLGQE